MVKDNLDALSWLREQLVEADPDLLQDMVKVFTETVMSAEADVLCGADYYILGSAIELMVLAAIVYYALDLAEGSPTDLNDLTDHAGFREDRQSAAHGGALAPIPEWHPRARRADRPRLMRLR